MRIGGYNYFKLNWSDNCLEIFLYINVEHRRCVYSTNKTYTAITHMRNVGMRCLYYPYTHVCNKRIHFCTLKYFTNAFKSTSYTYNIWIFYDLPDILVYTSTAHDCVRCIWESLYIFRIYTIYACQLHTFTGGCSSTPNKIYICAMQVFRFIYINFPFPHIHLLSSLNSARII